MKKIFLIIATLAFHFAGAQEFNFPDFQKRFKKSKKGTLIPGINNFNKPAPEVYNFNKPSIKVYSLSAPSQPKLSYILPNGNKVYTLPQDDMPCVMPDMSQFNMPVIKPEKQNYTIPNPAYPPQNKITFISPEQLKKFLEQQKSPG